MRLSGISFQGLLIPPYCLLLYPVSFGTCRYDSLNESLCTPSSFDYRQIPEVPGEKSLWSRREEGWHRKEGGLQGCGHPLLPQHCSDSMKPSFSCPTGTTSA